jgi:hypothetical protein
VKSQVKKGYHNAINLMNNKKCENNLNVKLATDFFPVSNSFEFFQNPADNFA